MHSLAQLRHHLLAMGNCPAVIQAGTAVNTPLAPSAAIPVGDLDDVQQHLGRDAPAVEADAADITLLDKDNGETPMIEP